MIDFLRYRYIYGVASLIFFAAFIGDFAYKSYTRGRAFTYSVDFDGGTQILLSFDKPINSSEIVKSLENAGIKGIDTRNFSATEVLVRAKSFSNTQQGIGGVVQQALDKDISNNKATIKKVDSIGSGIGKNLRWKSIQAVTIALILMLLYIALRFRSFAFAMGAVVSLFHDAIFILAYFLFFDKEISLYVIGAIIAVLGYSINDTIVIFARIRENITKYKNTKSIEEITNISLNETLRRTLLLSFATTLVVVSLLIFGGEVLRTLSLSLLIGIVFGTYSSIYIASPVMLMLYKNRA